MKPLPCFAILISLLVSGNALADTQSSSPASESQQTLAAPSPQSSSVQSRKTSPNSLTAIKNPLLKKPATLAEGGSLLPQLFQVALALLLVLGLIIGSAWLFRRFGQSQYSVKGNFRVIGGVHLSTREKVVLLQLGQQQLLLGVAPGRVNVLHVLQEPLDINSTTPVSESAFAKRLASLLQGKNP